MLIAHWDGRSWQELRPPPGFRFSGLREPIGDSVAALSGSYSWAFVHSDVASASAVESFALLRRNRTWRTVRLANGVTISSSVAFSPANAWAFGSLQPSLFSGFIYAYGAHFDGQRWRRVPMPVLPQGTSSPAPRNIWAVGPLAKDVNKFFPQPYALARWTGVWRTIAFPPLIAPIGGGFANASVVPAGPHGAWVAADLAVQNADGSLSTVGIALLHWTGSRWINIKVPFKSAGIGPMSRDGHGGLWIEATIADNPCFYCDNVEMLHYNAGQWSKTLLPIAGLTVTGMRLIPGTQSVWASGTGVAVPGGEGDTVGVVLKYGP